MMDKAEVREPGLARRMRVRILAALAVVVVLATVLITSRGDGGGSELAAVRGPSDTVVCDPLASDHPTCVREPDPTSTTIDVSEVTTPPLPTTLPPTTVASAEVLRLQGADDSLRVWAELDTA